MKRARNDPRTMEHSVGILATRATLAAIKTLSARLRALSDDDSRELPTHADLQAATQNILGLTSLYGPINAKTSLMTEDGPYEWHYIDPFALLAIACQRYKRFAHLLETSLARRDAQLVLYTDEFSAANPLHPDAPTSTIAIYWTFARLPGWWRCRGDGWFYFGMLRNLIASSLESGLSSLVTAVLNAFFKKPDFDLATGIVVEASGGGTFRISGPAVYALLQDLKAFQHTYHVSGCGGTRCCFICCNIYKNHRDSVLDFSTDPSQVHFAKAKWADCKLHTKESIWGVCDMLGALEGRVGPSRFQKLQQAMGLTYDTSGLLFNVVLRPRVEHIESSFIDSTHCLAASGGGRN